MGLRQVLEYLPDSLAHGQVHEVAFGISGPGGEDRRDDGLQHCADSTREMGVPLHHIGGGRDGPATLVAHDHDEGHTQMPDGVLDRPEGRGVYGVAGHPDGEQFAQSAPEHRLRRYPAVRTANQDGKWGLARSERVSTLCTEAHGERLIRHKGRISPAQSLEGLIGRQTGRGSVGVPGGKGRRCQRHDRSRNGPLDQRSP